MTKPYVITKRQTPEGWTKYGFQLADGYRQLPNWDRRKDAVASAIFHIEQRSRDQ